MILKPRGHDGQDTQHFFSSCGNTYKIVSENMKTTQEAVVYVGSQTNTVWGRGTNSSIAQYRTVADLVKIIMSFVYYKDREPLD